MSVTSIGSKDFNPQFVQAANLETPLRIKLAQKIGADSKSLPVFVSGMQKKVVNADKLALYQIAHLAYAAMADKETDYQSAIADLMGQLPDKKSFDTTKAQLLAYVQTSGNQKKFGANESLTQFLQSVEYVAPVKEASPLEKALETAKGSKSLPKVVEQLQKKAPSAPAEQLAALVYAAMSDPSTDYQPAILRLLDQIQDPKASNAAVAYLLNYVQTPGNQTKFGKNGTLESLAQFLANAKKATPPPTPKEVSAPASPTAEPSAQPVVAAVAEESSADPSVADEATEDLADVPVDASEEPQNEPLMDQNVVSKEKTGCSKWVWAIPTVVVLTGAYFLGREIAQQRACRDQNPLAPQPDLQDVLWNASSSLAQKAMQGLQGASQNLTSFYTDLVGDRIANVSRNVSNLVDQVVEPVRNFSQKVVEEVLDSAPVEETVSSTVPDLTSSAQTDTINGSQFNNIEDYMASLLNRSHDVVQPPFTQTVMDAATETPAQVFSNVSDAVCTLKDAAVDLTQKAIDVVVSHGPALPQAGLDFSKVVFQKLFETPEQVKQFVETGVCHFSEAAQQAFASLPSPVETVEQVKQTLSDFAGTINIEFPKEQFMFQLENIKVAMGFLCYQIDPSQCVLFVDDLGIPVPATPDTIAGVIRPFIRA